MKKYLSIIIVLIATTGLHAQNQANKTQKPVKLIQEEQIETVKLFVKLPQEHIFWTLYKEYEKKREVLGNQRFNLLIQYAENYENHSDAKLEEIINNTIELKQKTDILLLSYYERIKTECGIKTASQFYFIQRYFENSTNVGILGNLPIIDE